MTEEEPEEWPRPVLRVVRGNPDDAEIAALTAVLAAASSSAAAPEEPPRRSHWADRARMLRRAPHPGRGAWRGSALPR
jgi:hypothetical protein